MNVDFFEDCTLYSYEHLFIYIYLHLIIFTPFSELALSAGKFRALGA